MILGISRLTVHRKFLFLAVSAQFFNQRQRDSLFQNKLEHVFLDEMEDRVHTKCKPAAIALIVDSNRKIIDFEVSKIRPKTKKLYEISKKRYPSWTSNSFQKFDQLIERSKNIFHEKIMIISDQKPNYHKTIKKRLPAATHIQHKSRKAVVAGQGELKAGGKDPLFELNHTCAMLRANINRLIRKTWCTSKKLENLRLHIELYAKFHNSVLVS